MTTPKDKLPATQKLTAVPVANLPAPWPTQEKVKDLAADADRYHRAGRKAPGAPRTDKPQVQGHAKRMG